MMKKTAAAFFLIMSFLLPLQAKDLRYPLEVSEPYCGYIFSANYKFYAAHPVAEVTLANNTDNTYHNVRVSFYISGYMDLRSDSLVPKIGPREKIRVPLTAVFNNRVLELSENSPVQTEYGVSYFDAEDRRMAVTTSATILARDAMLWDRTARLASFITPKDPPVARLCREINELKGGEERITSALAGAAAAWAALVEADFTYKPDPIFSFSEMRREKTGVIDTVTFPREMLKNRAGDCDDLTALAASVFEGLGLKTAVLDYGDHVSFMFDTGETDSLAAGLPEADMVKHKDTWWVPVEATMMGRGNSFMEALAQGSARYKFSKPKPEITDVEKAWEEFSPITLPDGPHGAAAIDWRNAGFRYRGYADSLEKTSYLLEKSAFDKVLAQEPGDYDISLELGLMLVRHDRLEEARGVFETVLSNHPGDAAALSNLGSIEYLQGLRNYENRAARYNSARDYFVKAAAADPGDAGICLNLARVHIEMAKSADEQGKKTAEESAKLNIRKAMELDPERYASAGRQLLYRNNLE